MKILKTLVPLLLIAACDTTIPPREAPELHGKWEETFYVVMDTTSDPFSDPNFDMLIIDSSNYEKKRRLKPVRITYRPDGTFEGEHRNLKDSIFVRSTGTWEVRGDSLYFRQLTPDVWSANYEFYVRQDTLHLRGIIDWSRNGKYDDKFEGTLKKLQ